MLTFNEEGKLLLFECKEQVKKIKFGTALPLPFLLYFGYCLGHNIFIAHAIFKSLFWSLPTMMTYRFRKNIVDNAQALIDSIYLLKCGTKVEIKTVYGNKTIYDVKNLRVPT